MGPIGSPKTSVLNRLTPRNNPEDGKIHERIALFRLFSVDSQQNGVRHIRYGARTSPVQTSLLGAVFLCSWPHCLTDWRRTHQSSRVNRRVSPCRVLVRRAASLTGEATCQYRHILGLAAYLLLHHVSRWQQLPACRSQRCLSASDPCGFHDNKIISWCQITIPDHSEIRHTTSHESNASVFTLTFIGQTGRSCLTKCNSLWTKRKTLSHSGAWMSV